MSNRRYLRDRRTGAVVLADPAVVEAFHEKKTVVGDMESMKAEINNLKQEVSELRELLKTLQASN